MFELKPNAQDRRNIWNKNQKQRQRTMKKNKMQDIHKAIHCVIINPKYLYSNKKD